MAVAGNDGLQGALTLACTPFIAGWVAIMFGNNAAVLFIGRFLTGVGVGIVSNVVPVYIADVAPSELRGTLGSTNQLAVTLGILMVYLLGLGPSPTGTQSSKCLHQAAPATPTLAAQC